MQSKNVEHIDVKAFVKAWLDGKYLEIIDPTAQLAKFKEEFEALAQRTKQDCGGETMTNKITEAADKIRLMTDEELIVYVENRAAKAREDGFNQGFYLGKKEINGLKQSVIKMYDYVVDIGPEINCNYYSNLLSYINDFYTIIAKLSKR